MRWILGLLVVGLLAAELTVPPYAASQLEARVRNATEGVASVNATLASFPVVSRYLVTGKVPRVRLEADEFAGVTMPLARLIWTFEDVSLDRMAALQGEVEVTGIERGTVTAVVESGGLAEQLSAELLPCDDPVSRETSAGTWLTCPADEIPGLPIRR